MYWLIINDIVNNTSLTRFKVYDTTGETDSSLFGNSQWPGSGSAAGSPTLTPGTPSFSIANLQLLKPSINLHKTDDDFIDWSASQNQDFLEV